MSLFKKKENGFEDMDSQSKLNRISEQLGFLEKKVDTLLEELRNRGGSRPSFGGHSQGNRGFGGPRSNFRQGGRPPQRHSAGNTRYAGQGPRRYDSARPYGGGHEDNRGNYSGPRHEGGGPRHEGGRPHRPRRPMPNQSHQDHAPAPQAITPEAQPE